MAKYLIVNFKSIKEINLYMNAIHHRITLHNIDNNKFRVRLLHGSFIS